MMFMSQLVLIDITSFGTVPPMAKLKEPEESGVWNFRQVPKNVIVKAKIEAAIENKSVKALLMDLVEAHWQELDRKGILPKSK